MLTVGGPNWPDGGVTKQTSLLRVSACMPMRSVTRAYLHPRAFLTTFLEEVGAVKR